MSRMIGSVTSRRWLFLVFGLVLSAGVAGQDVPTAAAENGRPAQLEGGLPFTAAEMAARQVEIEQRIKDVKLLSADTLSAMASGATYDELKERTAVFKRWLNALDSQLRSLRKLRSALEFNREKETEARSWAGFTQQPPYPFSLVEQAHDEVSAQQLEIQSLQLMASMYEESLARSSASLGERHKELRLAREQAESPEAGVREKWLVQMAELRVKFAENSVESAEFARQVLSESLRGRREYAKFLEHKLELARAQMRFTQEELDAATARISKKTDEVQQELNAAIAEDVAVRRALELARAELGKLESTPSSAVALREKKAAVELAAARVETNDLKIELLRNTVFMTNAIKTAWEDRFWATGDRSLAELREKEQGYCQRAERQIQWRRLLEGKMNVAMAQSFKGVLQSGVGDVSSAERELREQIQANVELRVALYQRALNALAHAEELTQRLCAELAERQTNMSATGKIRSAVSWVGTFLLGIWNAELYVAEGSVVVDGRRIPISRSVTVGKVFVALLIFSIGIWLARRAYRITKRKGNRWFKEDVKIQVVSVALAIGVAVFSLCVAMASVRIPWSVFAFAGGALAIGVGFGAQTVVKNFITGILLIFGGSVRVGDTIEMDGQCGQVVSIGFSKSLLRRADGVELLVPNSRFMEQSLVNWTHTDNLVRQTVSVGVAYGSSSQRVSELLAMAAQEHPLVLKDPQPVVLFDDFGDNALLFTLRFWVALNKSVDASMVRSDLRHRINVLLTQAGISMPFPQRDVHLDLTRPVEVSLVNPSQVADGPRGSAKP